MRKGIEYKNISCVYCIQNKINGKRYIGQTKCLYKRSYQYAYGFERLKENGHLNTHLLNAVKKYGKDAFEMFILEQCPHDKLYEREEYWIKFYDTLDRSKGYNLRMDVGGRMVTHPETSEKISSNLKRQWANGVRDGHGAKLKQSWNTRDRGAQSELLSKTLTKYIYIIAPQEDLDSEFVLLYKELQEFGLKGATTALHSSGKDTVNYKGAFVKKVRIEDYERTLKSSRAAHEEF